MMLFISDNYRAIQSCIKCAKVSSPRQWCPFVKRKDPLQALKDIKTGSARVHTASCCETVLEGKWSDVIWRAAEGTVLMNLSGITLISTIKLQNTCVRYFPWPVGPEGILFQTQTRLFLARRNTHSTLSSFYLVNIHRSKKKTSSVYYCTVEDVE